jgi:hypothetical protein
MHLNTGDDVRGAICDALVMNFRGNQEGKVGYSIKTSANAVIFPKDRCDEASLGVKQRSLFCLKKVFAASPSHCNAPPKSSFPGSRAGNRQPGDSFPSPTSEPCDLAKEDVERVAA